MPADSSNHSVTRGISEEEAAVGEPSGSGSILRSIRTTSMNSGARQPGSNHGSATHGLFDRQVISRVPQSSCLQKEGKRLLSSQDCCGD